MALGSISVEERLRESYESLMAAYAFGTLDQAQSLIVAVHLTLSPMARDLVRQCEDIGGEMMVRDCEAVPLSDHALDHVLGQLDQAFSDEEGCGSLSVLSSLLPDVCVPHILHDCLAEAECAIWAKPFPGFRVYQMPLACRRSSARILKVDKGAQGPRHRHGGIEITLVLDGAYSDETGTYRRGDLVVMDSSVAHAPVACSEHGCCCLVVSTGALKLTGWRRIFNPFLK